MTLDSSKGTLTGDIQELIADDLGFSVDWTLKAKVELKDKSGKLLASKDLMVKKSFEKFSGFQTAMNMVLKEAFEQMMADPQIKKQIK